MALHPSDPHPGPAALDVLVPRLRCPVCAGPLRHEERRLACSAGHAFDIARHGYVNLP